jgi:hypothetical protein
LRFSVGTAAEAGGRVEVLRIVVSPCDCRGKAPPPVLRRLQNQNYHNYFQRFSQAENDGKPLIV